MFGARLQCGYHYDTLSRITQCHGNIAEPLFVANAIDGTARKLGFELSFIPREQLRERHIIQPVPHCKIRLDCGLRKTIPWARQLAVVATVDAIADQRTQLDRNARSEEHTSELQSPCNLVC